MPSPYLSLDLYNPFCGVPKITCPAVAHTHPSGSVGRSNVSGAVGSLYFPRRFSCASQCARRSARMRSSRTLAGSYSRPSERASSASVGASSPEQAARQHAGPVTFQVSLRPPQRRHRRIQPRELLRDLRNNAALLGEGREEESGVAQKARRHTQLPRRSRHVSLRFFTKLLTQQKIRQVFVGQSIRRAHHMELGGAATSAVGQALGNRDLAVFHTRGDLGEQHIAFGEPRITLANFAVLPNLEASIRPVPPSTAAIGTKETGHSSVTVFVNVRWLTAHTSPSTATAHP